jgi:class I fructose-bisphosphate aldolase
MIKVKPPTAFIEQAEAKKVYDANKVPLEPFSARIKHVMQAAFDGRRIVIFSGGPKETDDSLLNTVSGIHAGGGYGSIIGRNSFQRPKPEAIALLDKVIGIYKS